MKITAWMVVCLLAVSGCAVRPPDDGCPDSPSLLPVCLDGQVTASCIERGDISTDGEVNLGDLVILQQYVLGLECPVNWIYGDMNEDGQLDAADIVLLEQALLGL